MKPVPTHFIKAKFFGTFQVDADFACSCTIFLMFLHDSSKILTPCHGYSLTSIFLHSYTSVG
ncbi:hypothetical protein Plhal703r1_c54g0160041 [Plasmopara halstedii]